MATNMVTVSMGVMGNMVLNNMAAMETMVAMETIVIAITVIRTMFLLKNNILWS